MKLTTHVPARRVGLLYAFGRLIALLTSPFWLVGLGVLWLLVQLFIAIPYWLWTGEEL